MREVVFLWLMTVMLGSATFSAGKTTSMPYVVPSKNSVPVYADRVHKGNELPVFKVGVPDRLAVIAESRGRYKIRTSDGKVGWVEKNRVKEVRANKQFVFDNADVYGYLDDPTPVYIIDADNPGDVAINLKRSFKDELRENVDKYTIDRMAGKEKHRFNF